ncbi:MAG: proline--tRNA ligase [Candidatus Omnitrophica bacterium]|nr:proline--tRNA ligase [Candidatus Omnitrophota bacterium]
MLYSKSFIPTLKEDPADAEAISNKLMIRAGLIRKLAAGIYSYLPLGLRTLRKIENIVREEMDSSGALEVLMPALHPAQLWHETGRYDIIGDELFKFNDRTGKQMVIGPTHEEVITDIARNNLRSYKDLPKIIYQIQTKLRDEPRPRFGVIRSKEFIMKDAYSFDCTWQGLNQNYDIMFQAYKRIFARCGLDAVAVEADSGFMGGNESAEFMILSESGEDVVVTCAKCGCKTGFAKALCPPPGEGLNGPAAHTDIRGKDMCRNASGQPEIEEVPTPGISTIDKVSEALKRSPKDIIKTLIYVSDKKPIAVLIRGDHEVNESKLAACLKSGELALAGKDVIENITGAPVGFSGPCGLRGVDIIIDHAVKTVINGAAGANKKDTHIINVVPGRDFDVSKTFDIRYVTAEDRCLKCSGAIELKKAIEIGHVFKLGTKYSDAMKAGFLDSCGSQKPFIMGCYGIGINRIMASAIEQNNDKDGIIWPLSIAPYSITILCLNARDENTLQAAKKIYLLMAASGMDVLMDDRDISPGIKFKDADLSGIPIQVIVGPKGLACSRVEVKIRKTGARTEVALDDIVNYAQGLLRARV